MKISHRWILFVSIFGSLVFAASCSSDSKKETSTPSSANATKSEAPAGEQIKATGNRIDVTSAHPFDATVSNLTTALKENGMMIVAEIDHQNMLSMTGAAIKGAKTIEFGKPDMGKMILPMHPDAGLEMPSRFYVWETADGKTKVSYYKPSAGFSNYSAEEVKKMGDMMDMMFSQIAQKATS